jgi:hypothetical protein
LRSILSETTLLWRRFHTRLSAVEWRATVPGEALSNPAQKACRDGYSALYTRAAALFRDLAIARTDGRLRLLLSKLSRADLLVIDDWAMAPLSEPERRDFWVICDGQQEDGYA